jgi:integrase
MGLYRRSETRNWWMNYTVTVDGRRKQIRESTEAADKEQAKIRLAKRIAGQQMPVKGTIAKLLDGLVLDYQLNQYDMKACNQWVDNHLRPYFGSMKAESVTKETIRDFVVAKTTAQKPLSNASVNRCIALLKRSYNIAELKFPTVEMLKENNVRKGFVESDKFWHLFQHLPAHTRPVILFCYESGCRIQETLNIKWEQIDSLSQMVRLNPGETKNDEPRVVPVSDMMMFFFKQKLPHCSEFVFTYKGKHLTSIRTGWEQTCKKLGGPYEHLLVHDLRRSAVRNMVKSGVPEKVAMKISGHKSRSVFDRYNITSEADLKDAMKKMEDKRPSFAYNPADAPELTEFFRYQAEQPKRIPIAKIDPAQWGNRPKHGKVIVVKTTEQS